MSGRRERPHYGRDDGFVISMNLLRFRFEKIESVFDYGLPFSDRMFSREMCPTVGHWAQISCIALYFCKMIVSTNKQRVLEAMFRLLQRFQSQRSADTIAQHWSSTRSQIANTAHEKKYFFCSFAFGVF